MPTIQLNKMVTNSTKCSMRKLIFAFVICVVVIYLLQYNSIIQFKITTFMFYSSSNEHASSYNETAIIQTQKQRHKQLQEYCAAQEKLHKILHKPNNGLFEPRDKESLRALKQFIYNDRAKLIFCSVPKVASTNWKRIFHTLEGRFQNPSEQDGRLIHQGLPDITELSKSELRYRLKTHVSFLFTRHPFERVVSAYRDKLYSSKDKYLQKKYNKIIYKLYRNESYTLEKTPVTFSEFVNYIINEWKIGQAHRLNLHWRPVTSFCFPCLMNYTFIGKLHTINQDSYHITKYINKQTNLNLQLPTLRRYKTESRISLSEYYKQISDDVLKDLYKVYENDFVAFSYHLNEIFIRFKTSP